MNSHRGHTQARQDLISCRKCNAPKETVAHILNECPATHNAIVARHDCVVNSLALHLNYNPTFEVFPERLIIVGTEGFRPDLIVLAVSKNKVYIVEVT